MAVRPPGVDQAPFPTSFLAPSIASELAKVVPNGKGAEIRAANSNLPGSEIRAAMPWKTERTRPEREPQEPVSTFDTVMDVLGNGASLGLAWVQAHAPKNLREVGALGLKGLGGILDSVTGAVGLYAAYNKKGSTHERDAALLKSTASSVAKIATTAFVGEAGAAAIVAGGSMVIAGSALGVLPVVAGAALLVGAPYVAGKLAEAAVDGLAAAVKMLGNAGRRALESLASFWQN